MIARGYPTIEQARKAARREAKRSGRPVRIVHDTDEQVFRTTIYTVSWPQYGTVETVQLPDSVPFPAKVTS